MAKNYLYENGLPFTGYLAANIDDLVSRIENNKACMIIIDGQVGEGKTTMAVHIADYIVGQPIEFNKYLAMGGADFVKKLKVAFANGYKVIVYDEGGDFNRRGSLTKFNQMINRVFETFRAFKIVVIICLPSFAVLDSQLLDKGIPRLLIHCHSRTKNTGHYKGYSLSNMHYVQWWMGKLKIKLQAYLKVKANIYGHFLDLPPERSKELDKYSCGGKLDILDHAEVLSEGLLSLQDIAQRVNRSIIWLRVTLKKLEIKPQKRFKAKNYYNPSVLESLFEAIERAKRKDNEAENE